jgi:hypothetical protein
MKTIEQTTAEGSFRCSVGRDGAKMATIRHGLLSFPIFTGKIFRATRRKDGVLTWRLWGTYGGSRSGYPSRRFREELEKAAPHPWGECRHNLICD